MALIKKGKMCWLLSLKLFFFYLGVPPNEKSLLSLLWTTELTLSFINYQEVEGRNQSINNNRPFMLSHYESWRSSESELWDRDERGFPGRILAYFLTWILRELRKARQEILIDELS